MKVLLLISSAGYYGAENMLVTLAKGLQAMAIQPIIGVFQDPAKPEEEVATVARANGLEIRSLGCAGRVDYRALGRLAGLLKSESIDVFHTHGYKADCYGFLTSQYLGLPWVSTCHGWTGQTGLLQLYSHINRAILRRCSKVVTVSTALERSLTASGIPGPIITSIPNGIDVARFRREAGKTRTSFVIGVVSRLVQKKGIDVLLVAVSRLLESHPSLTLAIVGDGPFRMELERLTTNLQLNKNVQFLGKRRDIENVYPEFDVFVLPSLREGMPLCILEAMSANVPVVATRVGGIPEIVRHSETGLLVDPQDPVALADALDRLIRNPDLRSQLSRNAYSMITREFSSEAMTAKYVQVYQEILAARKTRAATNWMKLFASAAPVRDANKHR